MDQNEEEQLKEMAKNWTEMIKCNQEGHMNFICAICQDKNCTSLEHLQQFCVQCLHPNKIIHNKESNVHHLVSLKNTLISLIAQLYEHFDAPEHKDILKKSEFLQNMDKYIDEFAGLEKFFRCLKEQAQVFKNNADDKIPDVNLSYKNEVKEVILKILVEKNAEKL